MIFFHLYLFLFRIFFAGPFAEGFGIHPRRIQAFRYSEWKDDVDSSELDTAWFHAASVGELEMLIPIIESFLKKNRPVGVSVFSESALAALNRLPESLVYRGFSPPEGEWEALLKQFQVSQVFVAKYEAWPALWAACGAFDLPLVLINAQWRKSLAFAKRFLSFCRLQMPRFFFYALDSENADLLRKHFPGSSVQISFDPRWVRVLNRVESSGANPRLASWRQNTEVLPRPFVFVGSAWREDLDLLLPAFQKAKGTLWVIPHSLAEENIQKLKSLLDEKIPGRFVFVNEMGVLLELYSLADRIWVGGGFGSGIHSTLEAAVYPVPIACGPKKVNQFFETRALIKTGQLSVIPSPAEAIVWLDQSDENKFKKDADALKLKKMGFSALVEEWNQIR